MRQVPRVSVVLPVHRGVSPEHFQAAVRSLVDQTRPADEIVIVEDGPLDPAHREVIDELGDRGGSLVVVRLEENQGAGVANQAGLLRATGDWIAKMDADDINVPTRIERQLALAVASDVDVWGAAMGEFSNDPNVVEGVRANPATHEAIMRRMRWNSPINHPTAFYRRNIALEAGGYPAMRFMQDYDLFARVALAGATFNNTQEVLVLFRADRKMLQRRRSKEIHSIEWRLQRQLHNYGIIGRGRMVANMALRTLARVAPRSVMRFAHRRVFRRA